MSGLLPGAEQKEEEKRKKEREQALNTSELGWKTPSHRCLGTLKPSLKHGCLLFQLAVVTWLYPHDQSSQGPQGLHGDTTANTSRQPQRLKDKEPQLLNFPTEGTTALIVTVPGVPGFANIFPFTVQNLLWHQFLGSPPWSLPYQPLHGE